MMNEELLILYEDDAIVLCVKPAGVNSTDVPGGMPEMIRNTLRCSDIKSVHRLDQVVGGVMVYAKGSENARILSSQMQSDFHKLYLAVIRGKMNRKSGLMEDYLHRNKEERKTYVVPKDTPESQIARLRYQIIGEDDEYSLLKIKLLTGRTHQIRCQLSSRGNPIAGDRKYTTGSAGDFPMALWSYHLSFIHPMSDKRVVAEKNPPQREPWNRFSLPEISKEIVFL